MPGLCEFNYAVVRIVPRVDREEFFNAGVVLFCRELRFLAAHIAFDAASLAARLAVLAPEVDAEQVWERLELIPRICAGGRQAGDLGELSQAERFRWLVSPRSTVLQVSPVHSGVCVDPQIAFDNLVRQMFG